MTLVKRKRFHPHRDLRGRKLEFAEWLEQNFDELAVKYCETSREQFETWAFERFKEGES